MPATFYGRLNMRNSRQHRNRFWVCNTNLSLRLDSGIEEFFDDHKRNRTKKRHKERDCHELATVRLEGRLRNTSGIQYDESLPFLLGIKVIRHVRRIGLA